MTASALAAKSRNAVAPRHDASLMMSSWLTFITPIVVERAWNFTPLSMQMWNRIAVLRP